MRMFSNDMRVANTASPSFQSEANVSQYGWTGADQGHYNQLLQYVDECRKIWINIEEKLIYIDQIVESVGDIDGKVKYIEQMTAQVVKLAEETKIFRDQTSEMYGQVKPLLDSFFPAYDDALIKYQDVVKMHSETEQAAISAAQSEINAAKSAKDASDIAEELRKGQVYRGTWNMEKNAGYPPKPDTNSVWDVTLNEGSLEYRFDGTLWYWGDRLLYLKDSDAFSQIEAGGSVTSINGKKGAVTLTAADVGALDLATGGSVAATTNFNAPSKQVTFVNDKNYISMGGNNLYVAALNSTGRVILQGERNPLANVGGTDYTLYHTGNKPTPDEIGAVTPAGFTLTGAIKLGNSPANIQTGSGKNILRTGGGTSDTVLLGNSVAPVYIDTGSNVRVRVAGGATEYKVYHSGDKPTPEEIGAASVASVGSISARAKDRFDVRDFGAKGDGVTDDTATVQAALNKKGLVYFPKGIFLVKKTLTIPSDTTIVGAGIDETIIRADVSIPGEKDLIMNEHAMDEILTYDKNINIFDITLDAKGFSRRKVVTGEWGRAIRLGSVHDCLLQRVRAHEGPQHCVDITNHNDDYIGKGHAATLSGESYNVTVKDCIFSDYCYDDGITTHASNNIIIEDCISTISDYAKSKRTYAHNQNGFEVDDGSKYVVVRNCKAYCNNIAGKGFSTACHGQNPATYNVTFEDCWVHGANIFGAAWTDLVTDVEPHSPAWLARNISYIRCTHVKPAVINTSTLFPSRCVSATGIQNLQIKDFKLYIADLDGTRFANVSLSEFNTSRDILVDGYSVYGVNNVNGLPEVQKNNAWIAIRSGCERTIIRNVFVEAMGSMDRVVADTTSLSTTLVENITVERAPAYDANNLKYGIVCGAEGDYRNVVVPDGLMTAYSIGPSYVKKTSGNYNFKEKAVDTIYGGLKIESITRDNKQPQAGIYFDNTFYNLGGDTGKGSISYRATSEKNRTFSITAHMDDNTYRPMLAVRNFKGANDVYTPEVVPGTSGDINLGSSDFRWKNVNTNTVSTNVPSGGYMITMDYNANAGSGVLHARAGGVDDWYVGRGNATGDVGFNSYKHGTGISLRADVVETSKPLRIGSSGTVFASQHASQTDLNTLNDFRYFGMYYQDANANATPARNYPIQEAGALIVMGGAYGGQQEYTTFSTGRKFVRGKTAAGNNWDSWKEIGGVKNHMSGFRFTDQTIASGGSVNIQPSLFGSFSGIAMTNGVATVSTAGVYKLEFGFSILPNANPQNAVGGFIKNGAILYGDMIHNYCPPTTNGTQMNMSSSTVIVALNAGDTLSFQVKAVNDTTVSLYQGGFIVITEL